MNANKFSTFKFLLLLIGSSFGFPSFSDTQTEQDRYPKWMVHHAAKPVGVNTVKVCLYRDKNTAGFFSRGEWKVRIGETTEYCNEKLIANLDERTLYFDFDRNWEAYSSWTVISKTLAVYCPKFMNDKGYSPCTSEFFEYEAINNDPYKVISYPAIRILRYEAKAIEELERYKENKEKIDLRNKYIKEYETATTLHDINEFEVRYENNDPDRLIEKLQALKINLKAAKLKTYRDDFEKARSLADYEKFILEWQNDDPDDLVKLAHSNMVRLNQEAKLVKCETLFVSAGAAGSYAQYITECKDFDLPDRLLIAKSRQLDHERKLKIIEEKTRLDNEKAIKTVEAERAKERAAQDHLESIKNKLNKRRASIPMSLLNKTAWCEWNTRTSNSIIRHRNKGTDRLIAIEHIISSMASKTDRVIAEELTTKLYGFPNNLIDYEFGPNTSDKRYAMCMRMKDQYYYVYSHFSGIGALKEEFELLKLRQFRQSEVDKSVSRKYWGE